MIRTPFPLISPRLILWAGLLVNSGLSLLFLLWNGLVVRRWLEVISAFLIFWLWLWLWMKYRSMVFHLVSFLPVAWWAWQRRRDYYGQLFEGRRALQLAPLLGFLSAAQILLLAGAKPPPRVQPSTSSVVAPILKAETLQDGDLAIEYKGDIRVEAQLLMRSLLEAGVWQRNHPHRAGLERLPEGIRIALILPKDLTSDGQLEAKLSLAMSQFQGALGKSPPILLELYGQNRRQLRAYQIPSR